MSNNEPDYDNLYFEPIGDMSKLNDCNDGKRGSNVLVTTLEKCQKIVHENVELKNKLEIVTETLEKIKTAASFGKLKTINIDTPDNMRLKSIVALAEEALEKIKEKKDDIQK